MMAFCGSTDKRNSGYTAPVLGNGSIAIQVDYEGTMHHTPDFEGIKNISDMRIWWAGRRYLHKKERNLVSFGCFSQKILDDKQNEPGLLHYKQDLNTQAAIVNTACTYDGGLEAETEAFVHHDANLIVVKKHFSRTVDYRFDYCLCDIKETGKLPELMTVTSCIQEDDGILIFYHIEAGMYPYHGAICIFSDAPVRARVNGNRFSLTSGGDGVFYILLCDNIDEENYEEYVRQTKREILDKGYELLRLEHSKAWDSYLNEGYAKIGDTSVDEAYATAQYHLKCYTTPWSVPVGLNNGSWQGKYFAFDEFYILMGLLTSNHLGAAKRIPVFRYNGLEYATKRATKPNSDCSLWEAHYPWETLENGTEGAINGFWHDHVFHMACIVCGAYYYYKFSGDEVFLREKAWPVIKRCTNFYLNHMLYPTESGGLIVGKCTDLERLGHSRENAYMTTCGVIKTLYMFDETAHILSEETEMAKRCKDAAARLKQCLPNNGREYVPYPNCPDASISLLSGTYPFDVIDEDDKLQAAGIERYIESEKRVGNMYSVGTGVCSWYMTWKALVFARLQRKEETLTAIRDAAKNTGYFGEMYEINDRSTETIYRPWFTTAAGMLIHAVNEMLLQVRENKIFIAPALPEEIQSFSFRLAAPCGICVDAAAADGKLTRLNVQGTQWRPKQAMEIVLPDHIAAEESVINAFEGQLKGKRASL